MEHCLSSVTITNTSAAVAPVFSEAIQEFIEVTLKVVQVTLATGQVTLKVVQVTLATGQGTLAIG